MADDPQEPSSEQMQEELKIRMEKEAQESMYPGNMGALGVGYPLQNAPMSEPSYGLHRRASVRLQMMQQALELEQRAKEIRNLIKLFDENPSVEKILDSMRKLGVG